MSRYIASWTEGGTRLDDGGAVRTMSNLLRASLDALRLFDPPSIMGVIVDGEDDGNVEDCGEVLAFVASRRQRRDPGTVVASHNRCAGAWEASRRVRPPG
jgi:hypothetical protein